MKHRRRIGRGFTLPALLVTLAVIGLLAGTGMAAYGRWIPDYRLRQAGRALFSHFQLARLAAIKKNALCAVTFGGTVRGRPCDYVVYVDMDEDLRVDGDESVLQAVVLAERYRGVVWDASRGGGDGLTFAANDDGHPSIAFGSDGLPRSPSGGFGAGTAFLRNADGGTLRVVVSSAGNIRIP